MSKKRKIGLIALCIIAVLIMVISVSYAYFTSVISGESNPNVITSGTMRLEFSDGPAISLSDALPGDSVTKTFSVKNTGTLTTTYDVYFSEICNMFVDKTDLVYTIRHTSANGYELLTETEVPSTSNKIIDSQSIAPNETQTYEIIIKFLSKDENQDDNQGAHFSSKLNINNSKEPISCPVKVGTVLCSFNCDTDNDGVADTNIDNNNDGICDLNCYKSNSTECSLNCDTDNDGVADKDIDTDGDGEPDLNIDSDDDGLCDLNCDTDEDGKCDVNCDTNRDGTCDSNCSGSSVALTSKTLYSTILAAESKSIREHGNTAPSFAGPSTTDDGMYKTTDDLGTSYYYRGAVEDNYVLFGDFCWRIVRINGDKSIRLIYQGKTCDAVGDNSTIGFDTFSINGLDNDNAYVGYMYGTVGASTYEETHANINSSNAKIILEDWYATNLTNYDNYIADQIFCNDRKVSTEWEQSTGLGYGTNTTSYGAFERAKKSNADYDPSPYSTLICAQKNDRFTKNNTVNGNGTLSQKVGMLTYDEATMAGGYYWTSNTSYYLYSRIVFWLGSPYNLNSYPVARIFDLGSDGSVREDAINGRAGIRPVISLLPSVKVLTGDGTKTSPWAIKTLNTDYNNDGICDLNCDTNNDNNCDLSCDTNGDSIADKNIDYNGDGICDNNCDSPVLTSSPTPIYDNTLAENSLYNTIVAAESESITAHGNNTIKSFTDISETDEGMYKAKDDLGDVYYYRGNVQDNYVMFANNCWRVVRTNGDHSVRLIYQGQVCFLTGNQATIANQVYNSSSNDNAYVGYMYGTVGASTYEETHANTNSSIAKLTLEGFYSSVLNDYDDYIADQIFCNDRKVSKGYALGTGKGYGSNITVYSPMERIMKSYGTWATTQYATLVCPQDNDKFTKTSSNGNGKLSQKVGLLTVDEAIMAGGFGGKSNSNYYLYTGANWWLGSPYYAEQYGTLMYIVGSGGYITDIGVGNSLGLRPVISLNSNVEVSSGDGTQSNPWVIKTN